MLSSIEDMEQTQNDQLDQLSQDKLNKILRLEPQALSQTDIGFLKARRTYLTPEQEVFYADVLDKEAPKPPENRDNRSRSYRAMQRELSALGYHVVGVPRAELERTLDTIHGPGR